MKKFLLSLVAGTMILGVPMIASAVSFTAHEGSYTGHAASMTARVGVNKDDHIVYHTVRVVSDPRKKIATVLNPDYNNVGFVVAAGPNGPNSFTLDGNIVLSDFSIVPFAVFDDESTTVDNSRANPKGSTGLIAVDPSSVNGATANLIELTAAGNRLQGNTGVIMLLFIPDEADGAVGFTDSTDIVGSSTGVGTVVLISGAAKLQAALSAPAVLDGDVRAAVNVNSITPSECTVFNVDEGTGTIVDGVAGPCTLTGVSADED